MKKTLLVAFLFLLVVGCTNNPSPSGPFNPDENLFLRTGTDTTLIPLLVNTKWNYTVTKGTEEKPIGPIRYLLDDDTIRYVRLLPVREYDNNEGWGKYEYQVLCYITAKQKVFYYMGNRIYVGRYLENDNYGLESVMWDFELPTHCTENSTNYYHLNRNSLYNKDEDYLQEMPLYHTISVKRSASDYREYTNCKLFQFHSKRDNIADPVRINRFYFKQGIGLVRYQQFIISPTNGEELELYTQDLIEDF